MVRRGVVPTTVLVVIAALVWCGNAYAVTLLWPETGQTVAAGGEVRLVEDFHLDTDPTDIPCEAEPSATVSVNRESVDEVRERETPVWTECGAVVVTGGWVAIGFDTRRIRAVAAPPIVIHEVGGCRYALTELEGHAELTGTVVRAAWAVGATARLTGNGSSTAPCKAGLRVTGDVELLGPQSNGFGQMPWGPAAPTCTEPELVEKLSERMTTATRLAKLGALFPSAASAPFKATGAGTLTVAWYVTVAKQISAHVAATSRVLVARATSRFSARGEKRVRVQPTARGERLLRSSSPISLGVYASFKSRGSAAIVVTSNRLRG
jgi:hypothetical protein